MNAIDLAWAAGLFEGEGAIKIDRSGHNQCRLMAAVGMTDLEVLSFFHLRWGGSLSAQRVRPECRPQWRWAVVSRMARSFLTDIEPYLRSARVRQKAALALQFQAQKRPGRGSASELVAYRERQWAFWEVMHGLNLRGIKEAVA